MLLGTSVIFNASVDVITLVLSTSIPGKVAGFEPVAMITLSVSICSSFSPEILMVFLFTNEPKPRKTSILFFFIKNSIPSQVCFTTPFFLSII